MKLRASQAGLVALVLATSSAAILAACGSDPNEPPGSSLVDASADSRPSSEDSGSRDAPSEDSGRSDAVAPATDGSRPDAAPGPLACGAALPGPELDPDTVEALPGYAEELAAVDTSGIADPYDFSRESLIVRALIDYMLERSSGDATLAHVDARAGLGRSVLAAVAEGRGSADMFFLRRGLYHHYLCSRSLPRTLRELRDRYGDYTTWPKRDIACSKPKNGPRRIYANEELGVHVAETIVGDTVRETEVIFQGTRTDEQLDFAVYTSEGELSDRSTFALRGGGGITSAAPYTCMSCHFDEQAGRYSIVQPLETGGGCE